MGVAPAYSFKELSFSVEKSVHTCMKFVARGLLARFRSWRKVFIDVCVLVREDRGKCDSHHLKGEAIVYT